MGELIEVKGKGMFPIGHPATGKKSPKPEEVVTKPKGKK